MSTSDITIKVALDDNQIPENITWSATDAGDDDVKESKAMMLSFWDKVEENSLRMDLWTKEMTVDDMKKFYHQAYVAMADNFEKSTGEDGMAAAMRDFADFFGEKLDILPSSGRFDK